MSATDYERLVFRYQKRPVVIEAMFMPTFDAAATAQEWILANGGQAWLAAEGLKIETLEGAMLARYGDWIIRGVKGEFYPCRSDIFNATYEDAVPDEASSGRLSGEEAAP